MKYAIYRPTIRYDVGYFDYRYISSVYATFNFRLYKKIAG